MVTHWDERRPLKDWGIDDDSTGFRSGRYGSQVRCSSNEESEKKYGVIHVTYVVLVSGKPTNVNLY